MHTKDYYKILELPPHASIPEIKQAYRRLAMIYHPDKNAGDPYAEVLFHEIKEAYEVLTHPVRKELWLQKRWYDQSIGRKKTAITITPVNILKQIIELEKYVSRLDVHRMDKQGLFEYLSELLSTGTIKKLKAFDDYSIKVQIIRETLKMTHHLNISSIEIITQQLLQLAPGDESVAELVDDFREKHRKYLFWEKTKVAWIIVITLLICILIFIISR